MIVMIMMIVMDDDDVDDDYDCDDGDGDDDAHLLRLLNATRPLGVVKVCQPHLLPSLQQVGFANKFTFHTGHFRYKTEPFFCV